MEAASASAWSALKPQRGNSVGMKPIKLEMNKLMKLVGRRKGSTNDNRRPLMEENHLDTQDGTNETGAGYDNASTQHTDQDRRFQREDQMGLQTQAEILEVAPDTNNSSEDGADPSAAQQHIRLIKTSVHQHFPKPPADVDQNLHQHLVNVQDTVRNGLVRRGPPLQSTELIECHRQTFDHLSNLLQNISSSKNCLVLMKWVLRSYLSQELLGHLDLQEMDPIKEVDLLLFTEWTTRATDKLTENVQKDVSDRLEKILQFGRSEEGHSELYVDVIQCIDAAPRQAHQISPRLAHLVQEVGFQELLVFLRRYTAEQEEILGKKAKLEKPEMKLFFKTLNDCQELKQHVQTKANDVKGSLLNETVTTLENMEAFTLKLLMEIVVDIAERHLKKYFKSENTEFCVLIDAVETHFSELSGFQDSLKRVMDDVYKLIAHIYLRRLVQTSRRTLRRNWNPDVGQKVSKDAELLQDTVSRLSPGVQLSNLMLLRVKELLDCRSLDATKMTAGSMQEDCGTYSEDLELLPALLRWKGLSRCQIREVQSVLEDLPSYQPRPRSVSWNCCITC